MTCITLPLLILLAAGAYLYNRFVRLDNMSKEGWSGIDVQLKRRYDLIPNLVQITKEYMPHERKLLTEIAEKRTEAMKFEQPSSEKQDAENKLSETLQSVFALSESYPDLKANTVFQNLQMALIDVEDHLQKARRYYNATVRDFNTAVNSFPFLIVAHMCHFESKPFFEIIEQEHKNVKVSLHETH